MINQTFYPIFTFFEQLTGLTVQILFQALGIGALMPSSKYHTIHDRNVKSSLVVCYFEHSINNYIGRFCWLFLICFLINAQKNSITLSTPLCRLWCYCRMSSVQHTLIFSVQCLHWGKIYQIARHSKKKKKRKKYYLFNKKKIQWTCTFRILKNITLNFHIDLNRKPNGSHFLKIL